MPERHVPIWHVMRRLVTSWHALRRHAPAEADYYVAAHSGISQGGIFRGKCFLFPAIQLAGNHYPKRHAPS